MKDESVLKNLVQQEAKKKESVRNAETKITKLTEQLQATEKILSVNRMFLKKLQEQVMFFFKLSYCSLMFTAHFCGPNFLSNKTINHNHQNIEPLYCFPLWHDTGIFLFSGEYPKAAVLKKVFPLLRFTFIFPELSCIFRFTKFNNVLPLRKLWL